MRITLAQLGRFAVRLRRPLHVLSSFLTQLGKYRKPGRAKAIFRAKTVQNAVKIELEFDVLASRIECTSLRDVLHSGAARRDPELARDTRDRFNRARSCLKRANAESYGAGCWPPLIATPGADNARPYHERAMEVWNAYAERADKTSPNMPPVACCYPGCSARSHVHARAPDQTEAATPRKIAAAA